MLNETQGMMGLRYLAVFTALSVSTDRVSLQRAGSGVAARVHALLQQRWGGGMEGEREGGGEKGRKGGRGIEFQLPSSESFPCYQNTLPRFGAHPRILFLSIFRAGFPGLGLRKRTLPNERGLLLRVHSTTPSTPALSLEEKPKMAHNTDLAPIVL